MAMQQQLSVLMLLLEQGKARFQDVINFIDHYYDYHSSSFVNGQKSNARGQNDGAARVLAFGHLNNLSVLDTLKLFAEHYQAVEANAGGTDHENIRQFIRYGWFGLMFDHFPLTPKGVTGPAPLQPHDPTVS